MSGLEVTGPQQGSGITGTQATLLGIATLAPAVDSVVTVVGEWTRAGQPLTSATGATPPLQQATLLRLEPLSEAGEYVFVVSVRAENNTFLKATSTNTSFSLSLQPYPPLQIEQGLSPGQCGQQEMATLTGTVSLLPNTATEHSLTLSWLRPDGGLTSSSEEQEGSSTLLVDTRSDQTGDYQLRACLSITSTSVQDHCSTATYTISTQPPGEVGSLTCPNAPAGDTLNILWTAPQQNADSITHYLVGVLEYVSQPNSRELGTRPLATPFQQLVASDESLMTTVTSGVGEWVGQVGVVSIIILL